MAKGNHSSLAYDLVASIAERLDRRFHWDCLPTYLGEFTLVGLRHRLRRRNLYALAQPEPEPTEAEREEETRETERWSGETVRLASGRYNDLAQPRMGAVNTRFGRNTAPRVEDLDSGLGKPSPETVSNELLARRDFIPATSLNLLAAAWVQFEVHDWFSHRIDARATWSMTVDGEETTVPKLWRDPDAPVATPAFASSETHWWDASQLYGADEALVTAVRDDNGRLLVDDALLKKIEERVRPRRTAGEEGTPVTVRGAANMWVGLALLHTLFAHEHNEICETLAGEYPHWTGDRLYATARLINAAVMAKVHTVEWTAAIIAHPTTLHSIRDTWWGLLGEHVKRHIGRVSDGELLSGVPGSARNLDGVPYSLTEEFVAVYRMHPLIPDRVVLRDAATGTRGNSVPFEELAAGPDARGRAREQLHELGYADVAYSLGVGHPGAITLHNYPEFLRTLTKVDGSRLDLAAVDVLRTRECAVARYNDFRRMLRLTPAETFADLTSSPTLQDELAAVYENDVEAVDLMVGLYAEAKPQGFAFGDTAFRIFLLMASRRLRSDRFFTDGLTPELYTPTGLRWIADASMNRIIRRRFPVLRSVLADGANPFAPWARVA